MPEKSKDPFQFWEELKRRRVIRVITVYAAASFVLLELVDIISEPFGLPDWRVRTKPSIKPVIDMRGRLFPIR